MLGRELGPSWNRLTAWGLVLGRMWAQLLGRLLGLQPGLGGTALTGQAPELERHTWQPDQAWVQEPGRGLGRRLGLPQGKPRALRGGDPVLGHQRRLTLRGLGQARQTAQLLQALAQGHQRTLTARGLGQAHRALQPVQAPERGRQRMLAVRGLAQAHQTAQPLRAQVREHRGLLTGMGLGLGLAEKMLTVRGLELVRQALQPLQALAQARRRLLTWLGLERGLGGLRPVQARVRERH